MFGDAVELEDLEAVPGQNGWIDESYDLLRGIPNPFSPETTIEYEVRHSAHVRIAIYNVNGERVRILVDEQMPAGRHGVVWDGRDASGAEVADGVYYCRMEAGALRQMEKVVLMK